MRSGFDTVVVVDWSAASTLSPARPSADAIWIGIAREGGCETGYLRSRAAAEAALTALCDAEAAAGRRVLAGFDFPLGYPAGFAARLTGTARAQALWHWLAARVTDGPKNRNNRFAVAEAVNRAFPAAPGPFWGRPEGLALPDLPARKTADYPALGLAERRRVETVVPRAQPVWKLYTTGAVGSQALTGLPLIARLAARPGAAVWPFEPLAGAALVLAEVYPSLLDAAVRPAVAAGEIKDRAQVRLLAMALRALSRQGRLDALLADVPDWPGRAEEGWILGAGRSADLGEALAWA
ncbi:molybdopterin guanine dinucleotide synthesis [Paracoccaceae bacterium Fryx2]|nr:molybdopterin guanine dinucleotide synthesis [Paracoccaceae bacterium Fryx2]